MDRSRYRLLRSSRTFRAAACAVVLAVVAAADAHAFRWPWEGSPWPGSSDAPVVPLDHPTIEAAFAERPAGAPFRFAVFGDQRALADGEFQALVECIGALERDEAPLFVVDTGDIVENGRHSDQFAMLADILRPVARLPYLVGVGNHELSNNGHPEARRNTAIFLSGAVPEVREDRLWYRRDAGHAVFLFLDTNDLTYGPDGDRDECLPVLEPGSREARQIAWLREQVEDLAGRETLVVAVLHHPLVQSSDKHHSQGAALWNVTDRGESLADLLIAAGTDLVLAGHTHTYERFRLVRKDGAVLHHVNVSGRPRDSVLWIGAGSRRARDIRGREKSWLSEHGWQDLDRWEIHQESHLRKRVEANQFVLFTAEPDGGLTMEVRLLSEEDPDGTRTADRVRLR